MDAYLVNVYSKFGGLQNILSYNGTESNNMLFAQVMGVLDPKFDISFCVLNVTGQHLEFVDESGKICKVSV